MRCACEQRCWIADWYATGAQDSGGGASAAQYARIFGDLIDAAPAEELNKELVWYAGLLGQVRDCDVLSDRFTSLIADLPADQIRGPIEAEITKALATEGMKPYSA